MYSVARGSTGLLLLVVPIAHRAQAQVQAGVAIGDRIRYWHWGDSAVRGVNGTFIRLANDTFAFRLARDSVVHVPSADIARLEVSTGKYRSATLGALAGFGAGVLVGSIGGALSGRKDGTCQCVNSGSNMYAGAFFAGIVGVVAGAAIGVPREGWQSLIIPDIGAERRAVALGPRVRLRYATDGETTTATGFLQAADSTSIVLRDASMRRLVNVPRYAIRSSELSEGTTRHRGEGFVIGLLGGGLLAAGISAVAQGPRPAYGESNHDLNVVVAALLGALGGSVAGAIIGSHISTETWSPFELPAGRYPPLR